MAESPAAGPRIRRRRWWILALSTLLVLASAVAYFFLRRPQSHPVARGHQLAVDLGCFACHGPAGTGGIPNPGSDIGEVPSWTGGTLMMYVENEEEIREWILYGMPRRLQEAQKPEPAEELLVRMPAYEDVLTRRQLDDLVAYVTAVGYYHRPASPLARQGRQVALRLGCFGCHSAGGTVGVRNPRSFKGYIPPWVGPDFAELVRSDDELRQWILDGRIDRLENDPLARFFTRRQIIQMPPYRDHLEEGELEALIAYIEWLREE